MIILSFFVNFAIEIECYYVIYIKKDNNIIKMKKIVKLNDKQLTEAIKSVVKDYIAESRRYMLNEANNNMTQKEFAKDLRDIGFEIKKLNSGFAARMTYGGKTYADTIHPKHDNRINGEVVNRIFNALVELGYFKNEDNIRKFPFVKWGLQSAERGFREALRQRGDENHEIEKANELYDGAEVIPLFSIKDSVCLLDTKDGNYNLCRNENDKRPMIKNDDGSIKWFDAFEYTNGGKTPSLKILTDEHIEVYPINPDGTLGKVMYEHKINKKSKLWKI